MVLDTSYETIFFPTNCCKGLNFTGAIYEQMQQLASNR